MSISRQSLQDIARARLADAALLYENKRYSGSYYLYGYAVEAALKACISVLFSADAIPDKNLVNRVYSHKLSDLLSIAGLALELKQARLANPVIDTYWAVVEQWGVESRYESIDPFLASAMNDAVSHPVNGVFRWITSRW